MRKVLFICEANVGRSQIAEAFYNEYSKGKNAQSAGVVDVGKKYNFVPHSDVINVMREKGIDISQQKIKIVKPSMLENVEEIVVLCKPEILPQFVKESTIKVSFYEISDPYKRTYEELRKVRDEIEEIVLKIIG